MKCLFPFLVLITVLHTHAQKHVTKTGTISFEGSVETFQPIKATNESTTVVLDNKGNLAALVLIKGFRFPVALMQEHFNENYVESDKFPKATFKGNILNFDAIKQAAIKTQVKGVLTIHGISKEMTIGANFTKTKETIQVNGDFFIEMDDFDIEIPAVVAKKIATKIKVSFNFNHKPYKK
jgi:polyisoprenoid-binding protein YceI